MSGPSGASLGLALAVLVGCGGTASAPTALPTIVPTEGPRPDLVLVVVDGVRKDVRPEEDKVPVLLAAFPTPPIATFDGAYATSASTFTSFGSLLTGLYPAAVPLCRPREGASVEKGHRAWCTELPGTRPSLPDILHVYGYDTALLSTGGVGFDTFADRFETSLAVELAPPTLTPPPGAVSRPKAAEAAAAWWSEHAGKPRFLVLHITDVEVALDLSRGSPNPHPLPAGTAPTMTTAGPVATPEATALTIADLKSRYADAITTLASGLKAVDAALPAASGRDRYLGLVSLSGVNLGETTGFGEGHIGFDARQLLLERSLHVPLAFWGPGPAPSVDPRGVTELTDVLPTLLARVSAVLPAGASGRDLLSGAPDPTPWAYADFGDMLSLRQGVYRLTLRTYQHDGSSLDPALTERARTSLDSNWTLHHVLNDPLEATDLYKSNAPEDVAAAHSLHETLVAVRTGVGAPPPDAITPEKLWKLRMSAGQGYW